MPKFIGMAMAAIVFSVLAVPANAVLVTVDPDDFAADTDISNAYAGVTLSTVGGNGTSAVFSRTDSGAATGSRSFGHDSVGAAPNISWFEGNSFDAVPFPGPVLRVDFARLTDFVSILITNQDSFDGGILRAFDDTDTEIGTDSDIVTSQFGISPAPVTLSFSAGSPLISYITIAGQSAQDSVRLDFLQYNSTIPEPATIGLFAAGLAGLGFSRRRR